MKRRNLLKTILGTIIAFLFPKPKSGLATSSKSKIYGHSGFIQEYYDLELNFIGIDDIYGHAVTPHLGEVYFCGGEIGDWGDKLTVIYTNVGWVTATKVLGKESFYGISGHIMRCYGHPELASTESGLAKFRWENNL